MVEKNTGYNILTWNLRGMGSPSKRHKILMYLKRRNIHIALLQETHLVEVEVKRLQKRWRGQLFATEYSGYARGALIWVRAGVPFETTMKKIDRGGRYVLVDGKLDGKPLMLASIYAPNQEQVAFLEELSGYMGAMINQDRILGATITW